MTKITEREFTKAIARLADATGENPVASDTGSAVDMSRTAEHRAMDVKRTKAQLGKREPIVIVLNNERPPSWNAWYSGKHWAERNAEATRVHAIVRQKLYGYEMLDYPVDIIVTVFFNRNPQDCSNIAAKFYEDGLVGILLVDDSPKHVSSMTTVSRIDKKNPRVEIRIEETTK